MKTILTIIICLSLTACGSIRDYELERLAELCGGYKEIKMVDMFLGSMRAVCINNDIVFVND